MTDPTPVPGPVLLRAGGLPVTRGGGRPVRRIAAGGPPGGGWTVSLLDLERPGTLPAAAGAERVLTVVEGELLVLDVDGREQGLERHRPFRLPADAPVGAALPTGPVRALEVLAARGTARAHVVVLELSRKRPHPVFADQLAVLLSGRAVLTAGGTTEDVGVHDTVRGAEPESPELTGRGFLAVVSLDPPARD
ncbi:HutD family protein [Kocuria sabuli]|uniref:HutD family protein n=1 Tax=Kocuria sabuli TaxID=3071448 RepID=UPI0034D60E17